MLTSMSDMLYKTIMRTKDVLRHFGGKVAQVAKAIGITRGAVYQWPRDGHVPPEAALKLQIATGGKLKVNPADYVRHTRTANKTNSAAA